MSGGNIYLRICPWKTSLIGREQFVLYNVTYIMLLTTTDTALSNSLCILTERVTWYKVCDDTD